MAYRRSYPRDPYWLTAKFASECAGSCGQRIQKGNRVFYYPNSRSTFGEKCGCGEAHSNDFTAHAADEQFA